MDLEAYRAAVRTMRCPEPGCRARPGLTCTEDTGNGRRPVPYVHDDRSLAYHETLQRKGST